MEGAGLASIPAKNETPIGGFGKEADPKRLSVAGAILFPALLQISGTETEDGGGTDKGAGSSDESERSEKSAADKYERKAKNLCDDGALNELAVESGGEDSGGEGDAEREQVANAPKENVGKGNAAKNDRESHERENREEESEGSQGIHNEFSQDDVA